MVTVESFFGNATLELRSVGNQFDNVEATHPPYVLADIPDMPLGMVKYDLQGVAVGGIAVVDLALPEGQTPTTFYKQNTTTGAIEPFEFDGQTGALVNGNKITLYLQDGGRGDDDGVANGVIADPGGPGDPPPPPPPGGGDPPPGAGDPPPGGGGGGTTGQGGSGSTSGTTIIEDDTDWIYRDDDVSFWAYSTADPPPTYSQIEWDFAYDGTFDPDATASGDSVEHAFAANGTYTVAARFTTSTLGTDLAWMTVNVHHLPPAVEGPGDLETTAGGAITLTITETHEANIASIEWWVSQDGGDYDRDWGVTGLSGEYEFPYFGTYDFWVTVTDVDGEVGETDFEVYVGPATPVGGVTVSADANNPIDEANAVTFTVNELNWDDALDDVSIYADWTGSGEFDLVDSDEWLGNLWNDGVASFVHSYDDGKPDGVYHAKVRIENQAGENHEYPVDVYVRDLAPIATLTVGSPGAETLGNKVTDIAYSNQEVWSIRETTSIGFFDAHDASVADYDSQEYDFIVRKYNTEGTEVVETTEFLDQPDPWIKLPEYKVGQSYEVEGWLTDQDGAQFPHQKINVVFEGLVDGEPSGTGSPKMPLYGTMNLQGGQLPDDYNRYGYAPEIKKSGTLGPTDQLTVELVLDQWSQQKVAQGATVRYLFEVAEEHFTTFGTQWDTNTFPESTGTFTVPYLYPDDYRITVSGSVQWLQNGIWTAASPYYQVVATTPQSQTWFEQIDEVLTMLKNMAQQFGDKEQQIRDAITHNTSQFVDTLIAGFTGAANQIISELPSTLKTAVFNWIGQGQNLTLPENFDAASLKDFLLKYAGLTWDHVSDILTQELGEGNVAALQEVAEWLGNVNDENMSQVGTMEQFLTDLANRPEFTEAGLNGLVSQAVNSIFDVSNNESLILKAIGKAGPQLVAKFVPGAGQVMSAVKGLMWLVENRNQLQPLFDKLIKEGADALLAFSAGTLQTALVNGFHLAVPSAMSFLAGQIGLGNLPKDIKKALAFLPDKVDKAFVTRSATSPRTSSWAGPRVAAPTVS